MATNSVSPKKGKVVDIPTAPTVGTATAGAESATVAYTAATVGGPVTTFTALSSPGSITGSGTSSPITVTGLTGGTAYTFTVRGNNATGSSEYSSASNSITPTVATSYESIATVTVGSGGTTSISFSSIPSTYTHLQMRFTARSKDNDTNAFIYMQLNGDTASNYSDHYLRGDGSSVSAIGNANNTVIYATGQIPALVATASVFGVGVVDILDYANTNKYKTSRSLNGYDSNGSGSVFHESGNWRNTNAVSSITLTTQASQGFAQYSSFALYGIKG
jgi:hypothetical protein